MVNNFLSYNPELQHGVKISSLHSLENSPSWKMNLQVIFLYFLICNYFAIVRSLNDDGNALLFFKNSIENYIDDPLNNWNSIDISPCSWHGVTCRGDRVVSLSIPNRKLVGSLPAALGNLTELRHVNLRNNKLFGSLPPDLFHARELKTLVLSQNSLSGPIPHEIGNLKKLQILDFSQNSLNGSIPLSLVQCNRLKTLSLGQNSLTGPLTDDFGTKSIFPSTDSAMGNLSSLKGTFNLSHNFFNGTIPASLGSLPETLYIDLSYNNLSGNIPQVSTLLSIGPTAFAGNSLLCGLPLKISCSDSQSLLDLPSQNLDSSSGKNGKGSTSCLRIVITIVASVIVGICLIGLLVSKRCRKITACKGGDQAGGCSFEKALMVRKEFFCFAKESPEIISENMGHYNFVQLEQQLNFDLDQLLKASAFLLVKSGTGIVYKVVLADGRALAVIRLGEDGGSHHN
ncbi:receptor protein kinase-like protein zar1 [Quercus suber]|uniref:Receptor protein kinase-like protein zar1 n=1 Tax=Quercus suber TaxID=58331 RepID=A0AAW0LFC3_QUESU